MFDPYSILLGGGIVLALVVIAELVAEWVADELS